MAESTKTGNAAHTVEKLFSEFPATSYENWKGEAEKALKGASFDNRMITKTYEEIDLQPIYRPENVADSTMHLSLPGSQPFLRGRLAGGYLTSPWLIAQECEQADTESFNQNLKNELSRGTTAVHICLDTPTLLGNNPDEAPEEAGNKGLSLSCLKDLSQALADVSLATVPVLVHTGVSPLPVLALFGALGRGNGEKIKEWQGFIAADPLGILAVRGELPAALESLYDEMASATIWAQKNAPAVRTLLADGSPYHDAGANAVQELAFALSTAVEYVRALQERGLEFNDIAKHLQFSFSLGANMFMELAKIRAARILWQQAAQAFGGSEEAGSTKIHGRTSRFTKTLYDPYVNMLRMTTEAFAGVVAGLDSLHVGPFDEAIRQGDEFSRRIARNTQIILQQECSLLQPVDPAGGSWYVETITMELARKAWNLFRQIEEQGGMFNALRAGLPQQYAEKTVKKRFANLGKRKDVIVGTNMYANLAEQLLETPAGKPEKFRLKRAGEIATYRDLTDAVERMLQLGILAQNRHTVGAAVVETAISAAMSGSSVGELAAALRTEEIQPLAVSRLQVCRVSEQFEKIRQTTAQFAAETGDNVCVFLANMGPIPQHKPRADFSRGFFEVGGFSVLTNNGFASVEAAAAAVAEAEPDVAVICSTDATYPELVPPLAKLIKEQTPGIWLILAGLPPEDLQAVYKEAGVDEFIHVRADCQGILLRLQQRKGMKA
ncbi:methylmalonyl-CoA mutase family protein [Sporomusa aerivorans]|uniref:methylmalonyl-CoA mutase family protein n=1 Tax=Sporomusa aerivorans TaxID=204936 RepID=UPI00352A9ABB